MSAERFRMAVLAIVAMTAVSGLAIWFATPAVALDGKVGSDSAAIAVTTSADGQHVYICDPHKCYASHDAGVTFTKMKVE